MLADDQRVAIFRPNVAMLAFGALWWGAGGYCLLYAAGVVGQRLSFAAKEFFDLSSGGVWILLSVSFIAGLFLASRWFATFVITCDGIAYQWICTRVLLWGEVVRVRVERSQLVIWGRDCRLEIAHDFPLRRLVPMVLEMIRMHSPDCVIEQVDRKRAKREARGERVGAPEPAGSADVRAD